MFTELSIEEFRTFFAGLALVFSLISILWSWRTWRESNRPIVTVQVESVDDREGPIAYNLVVSNSGTRPALNIRMTVVEAHLLECISPNVASNPKMAGHLAGVKRCFSSDAKIPVVLPGRSVSNSFGYSGTQTGGEFWKYGSSFVVTLEYIDIPGHRYCTNMPIVIRDTKGFAGGIWNTTRH